MSTSAGRVMPIPKGAYDSATTYHVLDIVTYNGSSYICKATTTGNVPTNTTYWQLNASGSAVSSLDEIGDVDITSVTNGQVLKYNSSASKWVNGDAESGGLLPHIIVISESGSTVSAVKGGTTINFTETSSGHFEGDVTEFGTWTIHAVLSGDDATVSLVVDTVKVYTVDDSHFHADITAYYPKDAGATCALSASGQATQYATTSPYVFTVHEAGTYTLTVTYDGQTYTDTVSVSATGQTFTKTVPSASNAPINDYQMWLFFGGIDNSESTYTSLADILADSSALATLMSTNVAVDYLVRCKEWAGVGLVPTMTSNTTPSGECFVDARESTSDQYAYRAFDNDITTTAYRHCVAGKRIGYKFPAKTKVSKMVCSTAYTNGVSFVVQGSDDGTNWTDITTFTGTGPSSSTPATQEIAFPSVADYQYYSVTSVNQSSTAFNDEWHSIQFYFEIITTSQTAMNAIGSSDYASNTLTSDSDWCTAIANSTYSDAVLNVSVPQMTGYDTPSGKVYFTSFDGSNYTWKAFDKDATTNGLYVYGNGNGAVTYEFPTAKKIVAATVFIKSGVANYHKYQTIKSSDDNSTFTAESDTKQAVIGGTNTFVFNNGNTKKYWQMYGDTLQGGGSAYVTEVQFLGRENGGVQDWLRAGGITDKDYLTLAEVLADSTTLSALMASQSAVDYLVTCKGWATTICANQSAMQYIGLNNYCANTLLADSDWLNAIANSTYMESVLNVKVPTMTSATTPSGVANAKYAANIHPAWHAFDGDVSTSWDDNNNSAKSTWIDYKFDTAKKVFVLSIYNGTVDKVGTYTLKGSNDNGSTFVELVSGTFNATLDKANVKTFVNNTAYLQYRLFLTGKPADGDAQIKTLQFYGREDV